MTLYALSVLPMLPVKTMSKAATITVMTAGIGSKTNSTIIASNIVAAKMARKGWILVLGGVVS